MTANIVQIIVLLCLSALYSASETAITGLTNSKIMSLRENRPGMNKHLDWLMSNRQTVLSTILVSNNLVNIAASAVGTDIARAFFPASGVYWSVLCMTVLVVVFGEVIPKSIALVKPVQLSWLLLPFVHYTSYLLMPFVWCLGMLIKVLSALTHLDMSLENSLVTREEFEQVVKIGEASGALEESERSMIEGIISFEETRVSEIMVPRTDLDLVWSDMPLNEVVALVEETGRSRLPVYADTPDDIIGILYVKDLLCYVQDPSAPFDLEKVMRPALFVPETMKIQALFTLMRTKRVHLAVAVDEYGGTAGIVTMEDMLEEIVGDIQDEYDEEQAPIIENEDGSYLVEGGVSLEDFADHVDYPFESEEVDTVGGYVLDHFGNFPEEGDTLDLPDWTVTVTGVEDHRVNSAVFKKKEGTEDA